MLRFRNTYKNCKIMILYCFLCIFGLIGFTSLLMISTIFKNKFWFILGEIISFILFAFNFWLLCITNNDYKIKNYFKLNKFKLEFKNYLKTVDANKKQQKIIKRSLKDNFLRYGSIYSQINNNPVLAVEKNEWNDWLELQTAFNYGVADYNDKLSFLIYSLYQNSASGSGLEGFFNYLEKEPFSMKEVKQVLFWNNFLSDGLKDFLTSVLDEFSYENKEDFYARYEQIENFKLFEYEDELFECAVWLAYNNLLLTTAPGMWLHGATQYFLHRMFLSKDYKKIYLIYSETYESEIKYMQVEWKHFNLEVKGKWVPITTPNSYYQSIGLAYNDIKHLLADYIELDI